MKRLLAISVLLAGAFFSLVSCATEPNESSYAYKAFDTNQNVIVEGVISLTSDQGHKITGDWKLHSVKSGGTTKPGPQIGAGKLVGQIEKDKISLDLNPGWADNNVTLHGQITKSNITGDWGFYGFAGRMSGGTFEAVKISTPKKN